MPPWLKAIDRVRRGKTDPQRRFAAWRWRRSTPIEPPSEDPLVVFAVPLISARRAPDWDQVQANLRLTLDGFRRQSDTGWMAFVCGQDQPDVTFDDQVRFLKSTASDKFYDKGDKRLQLIRHVSRTLRRDIYYMQFDADDVLHPRAVAHMRRDNNGRGYLIDRGYFVDAAAGGLARLDPPDHPFWRVCGSSGAVRADFRTHRRYAKLLRQHMSHTQIPEICTLYGQPLDPVPFPAALYVVGHGQNMIERRGKLDSRVAKLSRDSVADPAERAAIAEEFGVSLW